MSDSTELRRIVGAMTERPWRWQDDLEALIGGATGSLIIHAERVDASTDDPSLLVSDDNATAIAALANHADALVALVEACEKWRQTRASDTRALMDAVRAVDIALAAVHAIKETP